jgi:hypothetical protein
VFDKIFVVIWTLVLSGVVLIFGLERIGISAEQSIKSRSIVNFSTPPLSSFGEKSTMIETSNLGQIFLTNFPQMTLELINPVPFTRIVVNGETKRRVMHQGLYSSQGFDSVYGGGDAYGVLKYIDSAGVKQKIFIWLAWPDYEQAAYTILYHFRTAVSDEIPAQLQIPMTDPESLLRGQITNVELKIYYPRNS